MWEIIGIILAAIVLFLTRPEPEAKKPDGWLLRPDGRDVMRGFRNMALRLDDEVELVFDVETVGKEPYIVRRKRLVKTILDARDQMDNAEIIQCKAGQCGNTLRIMEWAKKEAEGDE